MSFCSKLEGYRLPFIAVEFLFSVMFEGVESVDVSLHHTTISDPFIGVSIRACLACAMVLLFIYLSTLTLRPPPIQNRRVPYTAQRHIIMSVTLTCVSDDNKSLGSYQGGASACADVHEGGFTGASIGFTSGSWLNSAGQNMTGKKRTFQSASTLELTQHGQTGKIFNGGLTTNSHIRVREDGTTFWISGKCPSCGSSCV